MQWGYASWVTQPTEFDLQLVFMFIGFKRKGLEVFRLKLSQMKSLRNPNRKPTHPGALLREDVLPELGWTQGELAKRLMVSRQTVSDLLHEKKSVTAEMAIRIARTVGGSPESWLRMQEALDLWNAEMKFKNNPRLAPKALAA